MSATAVQRFYQHQAYIYNLTRWTVLHGRRNAVDALRLRPDSSVLEVGCGTGLNFDLVARKLSPQAGQLVGLDFSVPMVRRARQRIAQRGWPHVQVMAGDAGSMTFAQPFDGIFFSYSITMMPCWSEAIERAYECLSPGGRMVILDFGKFEHWGPLGPLARGWFRLNHVDMDRPVAARMADVFGRLEVQQWLGGYYFIAVGVK